MVADQQPSPIIIYGAPRSGTTYLGKVLNQQPAIFISHETRVFAWLHRSLNVLTQDDRLLLGERQRFVDYLRAVYPPLIRDFYRLLQPEASHWGDKNPHYASPQNLGCLETINLLFPRTRFIHIIRDGRDVVASLIRKQRPDGTPWVDFEGAHQVWTSHVDIGCRFGQGLPRDQYCELRYEELVRDDLGVTRGVFDFLQIEMRPEVAHFCRAQQKQRTPCSSPTRDLTGDVAASQWAEVLSADEQARSLELLQTHLARLRYTGPAAAPHPAQQGR